MYWRRPSWPDISGTEPGRGLIDSGRPVALVTGASSGIGEATGFALAEAGYAVALTARRADRLEGLRQRIETGSPDGSPAVLTLPADVTDRSAVEGVVGACMGAWGRIDLLVNSAGVMPLSPFAKVRVDDWERTVDVNLKGALFCIGAVLPVLLRQGSGHIVNISSLASRRPFPNGGIYSATKFALRAISDALRLELSASTGIRVTDIEPGVVETEMLERIEDEGARASFLSFWRDHKALGAEDVARGVLFAVQSPSHVNVNEILIRPTQQRT
jgi:NADP-dependent 3-hydroxy acid dehydrogenase YdfG